LRCESRCERRVALAMPDDDEGKATRAAGPIRECLSCLRCGELLREAYTVVECMHSFCRPCINSEIELGSVTNRCPKCETAVGLDPYDAGNIRFDPLLNDIILKVFPGGGEAAVADSKLKRKPEKATSAGPRVDRPRRKEVRATANNSAYSIKTRGRTSDEKPKRCNGMSNSSR